MRISYLIKTTSCLNFRDKVWWFLSVRVFGLLSSSLWLFSHRFDRYILRPSSGVCRSREASRNFEFRPLLNPPGSPVLIPLAITGIQVLSIPALLLACSPQATKETIIWRLQVQSWLLYIYIYKYLRLTIFGRVSNFTDLVFNVFHLYI